MSVGRAGGPQPRPPLAQRDTPPPLAPLMAPLTPRWFCHVDDDNYVNVRALLRLLASYPHSQDVYIGKPSLDRPIQATERVGENKMVRRASTPPSWRGGGRGGRRSLGRGGLTTLLLPQRPVHFWFATGGAGFCISRGLALKMSPWAR